MNQTLLIVGPVKGAAIEVFETAVLLGFRPVVVQMPGQVGGAPWECRPIDDLPDEMWDLPVFVSSGVSGHPVGSLRLDQYWRREYQAGLAAVRQRGAHQIISLVHPTAYVSPSAQLGVGVYVGPGVIISSSTKVSDFIRIGRGSTIGHDVTIGAFTRIGPGVTIPGNVQLAENVTVGPGASFINHIEVGEGAFIAAGSVVTRRVRPGRLVMGSPAREQTNPIKRAKRRLRSVRGMILKRMGI